jgi:DNA-binding NtrC family response regulator
MAAQLRVGVLVADKDLVGIDGLDLLLLAKDRWPRTRRILLAERPRGELVVRACTHAGARVLIKPTLPATLIRTVREELEAYGTKSPRH